MTTILPAAPLSSNPDDPLFVFPKGRIIGLTADQIGLDKYSQPSGGFSMNHSCLTRGILKTIQARNWKTVGCPIPGPTPTYMDSHQLSFLLREKGDYALSDNADLYAMAGFPPPPVLILGFLIHSQALKPRYKLVNGVTDGLYDFVEVLYNDPDFEVTPYTTTEIVHERADCSWRILHRIPIMVPPYLHSGNFEPWTQAL